MESTPSALPAKNVFCVSIVGPAGSGKTFVMLSMVKSKDGYRKGSPRTCMMLERGRIRLVTPSAVIITYFH